MLLREAILNLCPLPPTPFLASFYGDFLTHSYLPFNSFSLGSLWRGYIYFLALLVEILKYVLHGWRRTISNDWFSIAYHREINNSLFIFLVPKLRVRKSRLYFGRGSY